MRNFLLISLFWAISSSIIKGESTDYTFVMVHGAWHGDWAYYHVENLLQSSGNKVICVNLPGHGIDRTAPGQVTLQDYQDAITDILDTITGQAILVAHSMGGIAISMAAEARPEKVCKLVYMAAFMLEDGQSMLELSMQDTASLVGQNLLFDFNNNKVEINKENLRDVFYNNTGDDDIKLAEKLLTPEPLIPVMTPLSLTEENYGSVPRYYISTLEDHTITPYFQYEMYKELPPWNIYYICSDHSPFLSAPVELTDILIDIANVSEVDSTSVQSANSKSALIAKGESNSLAIQNEGNALVGQNSVKVYVDKTNQLYIESPEQILHCNVKIYSLNGRLLRDYNSHPGAFSQEFPVGNVHEGYVIAVVNINGKTTSQKILLYN